MVTPDQALALAKKAELNMLGTVERPDPLRRAETQHGLRAYDRAPLGRAA